MSRSTDSPAPADTWPADDRLLVRLRAARPTIPDEVASPHAPANQLMLERIVGGAPAPGGHRRLAPVERPARHDGKRSVLWPAAVAAAVAAVAGFVVAAPFGSADPSAGAVVRDAAVASAEALDSGRAVLTVRQEGTEDVYEYTFAGDDVGVEMVLAATGDAATTGERRVVDGELYWRVGDDPSTPWLHMVGDGAEPLSVFGDDPRTLLAGLTPTAGFDLVGDDTVDGVAVTRLRATTPERIDARQLRLGEATSGGGAVTELEVWVDGDDVVRRVDLAMTHTVSVAATEVPASGDDGAGAPAVEPEHIAVEVESSVRFTDIGMPNAVEAPEDAREVEVWTDVLGDPAPTPGG
jgi:hypothetical protein